MSFERPATNVKDPRVPRSRRARSGAAGPTLLGLVALLFVSAPAAHAQTLRGTVLERGSERPLDVVLLTLFTTEGDSVDTTLSDTSGRFRLQSSEPGEFLLHALALGYRTSTTGVFEIGGGGEISVELRLEPIPIEIAGIEVEASARLIREPKLVQNGFVDRALSGFGSFITPEQLEKSDALTTSELLQRTNRVDVQVGPNGPVLRMLGSTGYCTPVVYLDGVRIAMVFTNIDTYIGRRDLEAVEIYRTGAQAPLQFGGMTDTGCGVIVIWTKAR